MADGKTRKISLAEDFGDLVVEVNGVRIEVRTDGSVLAFTNSSIDAYTNGPVKVHPAANDDIKAKIGAPPRVGEKMSDGTVYAGISPDTHEPMYATPEDAPGGTYTFNQAADHAKTLRDFRVPTKGELNVLFNNHARIGGFDESGAFLGGWYWSSSEQPNVWTRNNHRAWEQRFSDGYQNDCGKGGYASLRCIR